MRVTATLVAGLCLAATSVFAQPADYSQAPPGAMAGDAPQDSGSASDDWMSPKVYGGLRGSLAFKNAANGFTPTSPSNTIRASYGVGGGGSLVLGMRLPLGLRVEAEGLYKYQGLDHVSLNGNRVAGDGNAQIAAPFLNVYWDMPVGEYLAGLQPFVGMGVGAAFTSTDINDGTTNYLHHDGWNLAYSFMAGAALPLSDSSRLTAMYRWMQMRDVNYGCSAAGPALTHCAETNLDNQGVDLGYEMDL